MTENNLPSPHWGPATKLIVGLTVVVLLGLMVWWFRFLIVPLTSSLMIAYLLHPIVTLGVRGLRWPRPAISALLYLALLIAVLALATGLSIYLIGQISGFNLDIQQIIVDLPSRIDKLTHSQFIIGRFTIDLARFDFSGVYQQIADAILARLAEAGTTVTVAASSTAEFLGWLAFVLLISFYMVNDMPTWSTRLEQFAAEPGYEHDVRRLSHETQKIWDAFLRGQLIIALTVGVINALGLTILDLRYAFVIGLLSGVLLFIPYVGPISVTAVGVAIALFQPGNWFGLPPTPYAIIVFIWLFVVQQFADYVLSPRIIGEHLELHPAIIMVGAIMGASIGGFIGLLLAAPILATFKLFGRYTWRKLLDLPPFPPELPPQPRPALGLSKFSVRMLVNRFVKSTPPPSPAPEPRVNEDP